MLNRLVGRSVQPYMETQVGRMGNYALEQFNNVSTARDLNSMSNDVTRGNYGGAMNTFGQGMLYNGLFGGLGSLVQMGTNLWNGNSGNS